MITLHLERNDFFLLLHIILMRKEKRKESARNEGFSNNCFFLVLFLEQFNTMGRFRLKSKQNAHPIKVSRMYHCWLTLSIRCKWRSTDCSHTNRCVKINYRWSSLSFSRCRCVCVSNDRWEELLKVRIEPFSPSVQVFSLAEWLTLERLLMSFVYMKQLRKRPTSESLINENNIAIGQFTVIV